MSSSGVGKLSNEMGVICSQMDKLVLAVSVNDFAELIGSGGVELDDNREHTTDMCLVEC
jgi:hypothetical protein